MQIELVVIVVVVVVVVVVNDISTYDQSN